MHSGTRPHIHDVVCRINRFLVMFDDDHGVAQITQMTKCCKQPFVVALVQADGRLIKNIHDPDKPGTDLTGQADTLSFATRERLCASIQRKIIKPDVHEELQTLTELLEYLCGDRTSPTFELQLREEGLGRSDCHGCDIRDRQPCDKDMPCRRIQSCAAARRTSLTAKIFCEVLPHKLGFRVPVAALHVGDDALKRMPSRYLTVPVIQIGKGELDTVATIKNHLSDVFRQIMEHRIQIELIMIGERLDQLKIISIASIPPAYCAAGETEFRVLNHPRRVKKLDGPEAVTLGARASGIVKGKKPWLELAQTVSTIRTGELGGEDHIGLLSYVE